MVEVVLGAVVGTTEAVLAGDSFFLATPGAFAGRAGGGMESDEAGVDLEAFVAGAFEDAVVETELHRVISVKENERLENGRTLTVS